MCCSWIGGGPSGLSRTRPVGQDSGAPGSAGSNAAPCVTVFTPVTCARPMRLRDAVEQRRRGVRTSDEGDRLTTREEIDAPVAGRTVATEFLATLDAHPDRTALRWMEGDEWQSLTFADVADRVARAATGLVAWASVKGDRVVLMMRNIPEFHWLDLAVLFCGATPVSIYNSSSPEQVAVPGRHTARPRSAIVEDEGFLERFLEVRDELPASSILVLRPAGRRCPTASWTPRPWTPPSPSTSTRPRAIGEPDDLATIIYTSGTTGQPQGRDALATQPVLDRWSRRCRRSSGPARTVGKRVVSYLPMAHIAERVGVALRRWSPAVRGHLLPRPSQIATYLGQVQPNIIFGVPRVWEKIYAGVSAALAADPEEAAVRRGRRGGHPAARARSPGARRPPRRRPDLTRSSTTSPSRRCASSSGSTSSSSRSPAPRPSRRADQLVPRHRCAAGRGLRHVRDHRPDDLRAPTGSSRAPSVRPSPAPRSRSAEDGEVICRGGNVFQGYLNEPEKTAEALDDDGWLHTGDIGEIDDDGYLRIVDRKKELIITAGGKNISPANLEAALKTIPLVGQAARHRRQPSVRRRRWSCSTPRSRRSGPAARARVRPTLAELAEHPDVIAEDRRRPRRGHGARSTTPSG